MERDTNATNRPSAEIAGELLDRSANRPAVLTLTSVGLELNRSATTALLALLLLPEAMLVAEDVNATNRPLP